MPRPGWITELNSRGVGAVAQTLGLVLDRHNGGLGPCPACHKSSRGTTDSRPPVGLTSDGGGWSCFACGARGDATALAFAVLTGSTAYQSTLAREIRERLSVGRTTAVPVDGAASRVTNPATSKPYPPAVEVDSLWAAAGMVIDDADVVRWMTSRSIPISPGRVLETGVARVISAATPLPWWAAFRRAPWSASGHRLLVEMFDHGGERRSVHARSIRADAAPGEKAASPAGCRVGGLVMADPLGRRLLAGDQAAERWVAESRGRVQTTSGTVAVGLVVVEGLPDFLLTSTSWSDCDELAPAVLGIVAGSWTNEIANRVPAAARVLIATDPDEAGERYARTIAATLRGHRLLRWRPRRMGAAND